MSISGNSPRGGQSFDIPENQGALIETSGLLCLVELHDAKPNRRTYTFRCLHKDSGIEITGDGEVFERYYRLKRPDHKGSRVVDRGSSLTIDAGFLRMRWSLGRWIYYDQSIASVSAASATDFETRVNSIRTKR